MAFEATPKRQAVAMVDQAMLVDLLQQMIAIPSRNPPGEEKAMAEFLAAKAQAWGLEARLIPEPFADRPQVVITYRGVGEGPTLVLNGHLDTVPEMDQSRWATPPFQGTVKGNYLYGRGACDMKAGLAAGMVTAWVLAKSDIRLRGNLVIQGAIGEETGEPGTRTLLVDQGIRGDWGIVLEPTDLRIASATRGVAWYHIHIKGTPGHASRPADAKNPILPATKVIQAIENYNHTLKQRNHSLLGAPTVAVTMLQSGEKENIIPGNAMIAIDRRTIPGESAAQIEQELCGLIDSIQVDGKGLDYDIQLTNELSSAEIPTTSELVQVMSRNFVETLGRATDIFGTPYGSDMRNFINDANMPAVNFGPGSIAQAHAYDEFVDINQLVDCTRVLVATAVDLLS
jgi:succinyl-diaminopimelate desuccinylase